MRKRRFLDDDDDDDDDDYELDPDQDEQDDQEVQALTDIGRRRIHNTQRKRPRSLPVTRDELLPLTETIYCHCTWDGCDFRCPRAWSLQRHVQSIHLGIRHYCHLCDANYKYKDKLQTHINKIHHKNNKNNNKSDTNNSPPAADTAPLLESDEASSDYALATTNASSSDNTNASTTDNTNASSSDNLHSLLVDFVAHSLRLRLPLPHPPSLILRRLGIRFTDDNEHEAARLLQQLF